MKLHIQKIQHIPSMKSQRSTPRHIRDKPSKAKCKEGILKEVRRDLSCTNGSSIRLTANFSSEMMETRRQWEDTLKVLKEKEKTFKQEFCIQQNNNLKLN